MHIMNKVKELEELDKSALIGMIITLDYHIAKQYELIKSLSVGDDYIVEESENGN